MTYRWQEHTSELQLHIDAASEPAVFEEAVAAFAELADENTESELAEQGAEGPAGEAEAVVREVVAVAGDRPALLAAFLEELVYLLETDDLVPERIDHIALTDDGLTATLHGRRSRPRHLVKGVTYNELTFAREGERYTATVVLDV
jgi:SHS2 domain-containing protein